ncbi:MAG: helix-turn-helix transcriptional regulator [Clostridiales bacterium]|nr:helix-turn-helix transcriptional regulator [Clostridiales bacterium]
MYTMNDFRNRFKAIRKKSRWKVRELSLAIGKKAFYISNFENGKENMSIEDLLNVCNILQTSPIYFFDIENWEEGFEYDVLKKRTEELPSKIGQYLKWYFSLKRR